MPTPAADIMQRFAERTVLRADDAARRYLWTDAFALCNYLGLAASGELPDGRQLALRLMNAVHHELGRHRRDDVRQGWISGLGESEGENHPTAGGLRIGKLRPERAAGATADASREWDQDGQYFHYLTRWMHALDQLAWSTGEIVYNLWARELAATAFRAFSYVPAPGEPRRMYWKMSIDLSRPLVPAMGHHDPLDGYLTCLQLVSSASLLSAPGTAAGPIPGGTDVAFADVHGQSLDEAVQALGAMVAGGDWATADPLGLGSLMIDSYRLFQIEQRGQDVPDALLPVLLRDARGGLDHLLGQRPWEEHAPRRLAFRELGLAIGLEALNRLRDRLPLGEPRQLSRLLTPMLEHHGLAARLIAFWLDASSQRGSTWVDHRDINEVMLATALAPDGYLEL